MPIKIALPTDLSNLHIKKYSNLLGLVRVMVFLYATTVSLVKLIFYVKNKKAVDLNIVTRNDYDFKLQYRIIRNNTFSRYLSPETY